MAVAFGVHSSSNETSVVEYTLARDGLILSVGGRWDAFAKENDAVERADGGVIGTSIWQWVTGEETKYLLSSVFKHVRASQASVTIPYRCDAPDVERHLYFHAYPEEDGRIRLVHRMLREEPRATREAVLDRRQEHSEALLAMCSWCCKIKTASSWTDLHEAVAQLSLLSTDRPPKITHGICSSCEERVFRQLEDQPESPRTHSIMPQSGAEG